DLFMGSVSGVNYTGYYLSGFTSLGNWKSANGGIWDQHSHDLDPVFVNASAGDLTPSMGILDDQGTPVGVVADITGAPRSTTNPDIGAYEFTGTPCFGQP